MRKKYGAKTWLYLEPVLILATYNEDGSANAMNAAWGGISNTNEISICLDRNHKTTKNILRGVDFTVSPGTKDKLIECDYVGIVSANNTPDKLSKIGFTTTKSEFVNAPIINELPMTLECRLISYDEKTEILKGEIVNVSADEKVLTNGKIDVSKLAPITFDAVNNAYHVVGEKVGNAFRDGLSIKK